MSAPIVVPFNFDPIATTVRTANYTIPAGRYAKVTPLSLASGINTLQFIGNTSASITDRSLSLNSSVFYRYAASAYFTNNGATYTVTFPYTGEMLFIASGFASFSIDGVSIGANPLSNFPYTARVFSHNSGGGVFGTVYSDPLGNSDQPFFVKAGDIIGINSTGRFLTEEYNKIS